MFAAKPGRQYSELARVGAVADSLGHRREAQALAEGKGRGAVEATHGGTNLAWLQVPYRVEHPPQEVAAEAAAVELRQKPEADQLRAIVRAQVEFGKAGRNTLPRDHVDHDLRIVDRRRQNRIVQGQALRPKPGGAHGRVEKAIEGQRRLLCTHQRQLYSGWRMWGMAGGTLPHLEGRQRLLERRAGFRCGALLRQPARHHQARGEAVADRFVEGAYRLVGRPDHELYLAQPPLRQPLLCLLYQVAGEPAPLQLWVDGKIIKPVPVPIMSDADGAGDLLLARRDEDHGRGAGAELC